MSDLDENKDGLFGSFKGQASKFFGKTNKVKETVQDMTDSVTENLSEIKDIAKEHGSNQLSNLKSEAEDLKRIFQSKDLIYRKSDAIAIVLRKLGNTDGFLDVVEQLTKEGYRLVHQENVRDIPVFAGFKYSFGSFYYFQNKKYIKE